MKRILFLTLLFSGVYMTSSTGLYAQATSTTTSGKSAVPLDSKAQKKVDKMRLDLAKDQQKFHKDTEAHEKATKKLDKDIAKEKLTADQIAKAKAKLDKKAHKLEKLKTEIAKLEKNLSSYE